MSYLGVNSIICQAFGIPILCSLTKDLHFRLIFGCIIMITAFFGETLTPNLYCSLLTTTLLYIGCGFLLTLATSKFSQYLPPGNRFSFLLSSLPPLLIARLYR